MDCVSVSAVDGVDFSDSNKVHAVSKPDKTIRSKDKLSGSLVKARSIVGVVKEEFF